jgi:hypothetical protein
MTKRVGNGALMRSVELDVEKQASANALTGEARWYHEVFTSSLNSFCFYIELKGGGFFVKNKAEYMTSIKIAGDNAERFLANKGILDITQQDNNGNFVVGVIEGDRGYTLLGETLVSFGETETDFNTNQEVTLTGTWVKGRKNQARKLPFRSSDATAGRRVTPPQEFTKGVNILVETTAPVTIFKRTVR